MRQIKSFKKTREVDGLTQQIQEEIDTMKNENTLSMNNQKNETRSDHKEIDMTIQKLNSKLAVQLGEARTALESTRWETIWKGLGNFFFSFIFIIRLFFPLFYPFLSKSFFLF